MVNESKSKFPISTLIGIAGIIVVFFGVYLFLTNIGVIGSQSKPAEVAADYSSVGQSQQVETVHEVVVTSTPAKVNTSTPEKTFTAPQKPPVKLPFVAPPFNGADWIYDWGNASITDGALTFGASTASTGGDLFLSSSTPWTNYRVQAGVNWIAGESFGMIARWTDGKNFLYCNFANKTVQIIVRQNGNDVVIASADNGNGGAGTTQKLGVIVFGNNIGCTINGGEVLGAAMVGNRLISGGIGLISWDRVPGVSKISLKSLTVDPLVSNPIVVPFPAPKPVVTTPAPTPVASSSVVVAPVVIAKATLPYSVDNFSTDSRWQRTWGVMTINDNHYMTVESAADTTGGEAILTNTDNWIDYRMSAVVDWNKGQTFMIIGRYQDFNNYVGCNFVKDPNAPGTVMIQLKKYVNGNAAVLQTGVDNDFVHEGTSDIKLALGFSDSQVTCSFNGHTISNTGGGSYGVSPAPGTIGFTTWDSTRGNTKLTVKNVTVNPLQ